MHGPEPVGWMLVALCGTVGVYCLRQARDGAPGRRREAAGEAVMGLGMAVMALPASAVEPPPPPTGTMRHRPRGRPPRRR
ncbi:hypothetical protein [Streptomyces sp. CNQ085]|uniref:hypothetical protein n=1 Tax=Streptomyces sp. CNQ085 TaxID=2886944 RepID=UPI0027E3C9F9|nr:hypothetical protein [Streptomyces sp. CNQ085]